MRSSVRHDCFKRSIGIATGSYRYLSYRYSTVKQRIGNEQSREYDLNYPHLQPRTHHRQLPRFALQTFLPKGFPESVHSGYFRYAAWQALSSISGTICGVLSTQSLLLAVGVGSAASVPLAATMNWILKDGLGQLGGIIFAGLVSNRFDAHPKFWRLMASVAMEIASFIELLLPLAPQYFLLGASVANVGKNISFLAASASRAALHKALAVHGNLADVTAKAGAQGIVCSLLGTSLGVSAAALCTGNYPATVACFLGCSLVSIGACYQSLRAVTLTALTVDRLDIVLDASLRHGSSALLSPEDLRQREELLCMPVVPGARGLVVNAPVHAAFTSTEELRGALELFKDSAYLLAVRHDKVHLLVKEGASTRQVLEGLLHAFLLRREQQLAADAILSTLTHLQKCKHTTYHVCSLD